MEFSWAASGMSELFSTLPWENVAGRPTSDAGLPNLQKSQKILCSLKWPSQGYCVLGALRQDVILFVDFEQIDDKGYLLSHIY